MFASRPRYKVHSDLYRIEIVSNHRKMNRYQRQRQLNAALSVYPTFSPLADCQIYLLNASTLPSLIKDLIELARRTTRFTIDTECDYLTHEPALIQIEFLNINSAMILIETCHLPHASSVLFWLIRSLLKVIFQPANTILSWGDVTFELSAFVHYGLFSLHAVHQITNIDVQLRFKEWYNQTFPHTCGLQPSHHDDSTLCVCSHRPIKQTNNPWSLQRAIAYTFHEFLDKTPTKSDWSQSLSLVRNVYQHSTMKRNIRPTRTHLITYAANDCLAVTKLMMVVDLNWTRKQLQQFNQS